MPAPPPSTPSRDLVVLRVPADPQYARVARVAVSAYAVRLGLVPADVEDLRLAVDEGLILLMGSGRGLDRTARASEPGSIVLSLDAVQDHPPVTVDLRLDPPPPPSEPDAAARSRFEEIVPDGVAVVLVDQGAGQITFRHPG